MGRDGFTGLAILALCAVLFAATLGLERHPMVPVGPDFYPRIVLVETAVLAALLVALDVVAHRRGKPAAAAQPKAHRANYGLVATCFAVFAVYVVALPYLGFRLATLAFLLAMPVVLEPPSDRRRWVLVVIVAIVATAATYFVFERYLHVLLPRGRWTGF